MGGLRATGDLKPLLVVPWSAAISPLRREQTGHYLNEARAAGALVLTTDHPPMNELVRDGVTGLLQAPGRTGSWPEWQVISWLSPVRIWGGGCMVLRWAGPPRVTPSGAGRPHSHRRAPARMRRPQVLANLTHINAYMDPQHVCAVVQRAMQLPLKQREQLGMAARRAFLADHTAFTRRAAYLSEYLKQQLAMQAAVQQA